MITLFLQTIVVLAGAVIVFRAEPALNRMSRATPFMVRVAFHLLALGAAAEIVFVLFGDVPGWPSAIVTAGVAALLICERRMRLLCPPQKRRTPHDHA